MKIRLRIREIRQAHGMSRAQLAKKLCYTEQTVARWEQQVRLPDIDTLAVIADIFGCTLDELVERQKEE